MKSNTSTPENIEAKINTKHILWNGIEEEKEISFDKQQYDFVLPLFFCFQNSCAINHVLECIFNEAEMSRLKIIRINNSFSSCLVLRCIWESKIGEG